MFNGANRKVSVVSASFLKTKLSAKLYSISELFSLVRKCAWCINVVARAQKKLTLESLVTETPLLVHICARNKKV